MHITRDNNYSRVTNNVQNSQIKSIKMYSLFSENSTNKDPHSPVTLQNTLHKPNTILKYFFQVLKLEIQTFQNIFILYELAFLAIFNFHPHGPVCLFLPNVTS